MPLIINSISKEYVDHSILDNISFTLTDREVIGLIGANGSGKSTLLKIIAGLETSDTGSVIATPSTLSVGYVPQVSDFDPDLSVADALAHSLNLSESEYYQVYTALNKLKLDELALQKVGHLSSGQKTKVFLARLLVQQPDILLLDEPTNHLDLESLSWLENYLRNFPGSVLLVSHDRRFLDNTVTRIIELDGGHLRNYGGNYSAFKLQKQQELDAQVRTYQAFVDKESRLLDCIAKVKKRGQDLEAHTNGSDYAVRKKAAAAASRAKSQEKMLTRELDTTNLAPPPVPQNLSILFKPHRESSPTVVFLDHVSKSFGDHQIIHDLSLVIQKGDRLCLVGSNGSGKSTLIKLIQSELIPTSGEISHGNNIDIGYLPQEHDSLTSVLPLLDYLIQTTRLDRTSAYRLCIHFLFTSEDLKTPVINLSSGQKSKLALIAIIASGANFLILDEPTNYLDIPARMALESALTSYPGTLLVVSHDRYFLDTLRLGKRITL